MADTSEVDWAKAWRQLKRLFQRYMDLKIGEFAIVATEEFKREVRKAILQAILMLIGYLIFWALVTIALLTGLNWLLGRLGWRWSFLWSALEGYWGPALGTAGVVLLGSSLFLLKLKRQFTYGTLEFCFAVAVCWSNVGKLGKEGALANWLAVGTAAYLVVRGLENIVKGIEAADEERRKQAAALKGQSTGSSA